MNRIYIKVHGEVQGVLYRSGTVQVAQKLGLTGSVKNSFDGSVEIVAEGEKDSLEKLLEWCRKGPSYAKVEDLEVSWEEPTGEFSVFDVRY
jgi:acylphosphatase